MDTRLLIQGQRTLTVCMPISEDLAKTLLMLCQTGDRLSDNINIPRSFEVEVHTPPLTQIRRYGIADEEEVASWGGEGKVMRAQLYYDMRLRGLAMAVLERKDGKLERACNTICLIEADLTTLLGRLQQRKAMEEREVRIAERGGKDRRKGQKGRSARQRIGQIKQALNQAEASADEEITDHEETAGELA